MSVQINEDGPRGLRAPGDGDTEVRTTTKGRITTVLKDLIFWSLLGGFTLLCVAFLLFSVRVLMGAWG